MIDKARIRYLLQQELDRQLSAEEKGELSVLTGEGGQVREVLQELMEEQVKEELRMETQGGAEQEVKGRVEAGRWDGNIAEILAADKVGEVNDRRRWVTMHRRWWMAAAVVLIIGSAAFVLVYSHQQAAPTGAMMSRDVAPGGNKAILTLSNGQRVMLDSAHDGVLSRQGGTQVVKLADGQLAYHEVHSESGKTEAVILYNTMSTPRGGQYKLILPDGTAVWLDAESSITYPTSFAGRERAVTITGEAYLEVAKDRGRSFRVKMNDMEIGVLGTHFNVNGYKDEGSMKTTLLEGSVKVERNGAGIVLKPGQQARVDEQIHIVDGVDVEQAVAWKDGFFSFNNADLQTVMRQLARWYNVEVKYPAAIPKGSFSGEIGRALSLSQVLKILEQERVQFKIEEGKRIVILP
jgi:ferric-dicitrate binding protein FerR (iron transport regulator)